MFVPLPIAIAERQQLKGDFTFANFLRGKAPSRLERDIGYRAGRLGQGWWLMLLTEMPRPEDFEYRGYTHLPGGQQFDPVLKTGVGPTTHAAMKTAGMNLDGSPAVSMGMRARTIAEKFSLSGPRRIAKVRPVAAPAEEPGVPDYPPGMGIPQYTLVRPLWWVAAAFVRPGEAFQGTVS